MMNYRSEMARNWKFYRDRIYNDKHLHTFFHVSQHVKLNLTPLLLVYNIY
jgi:hypothetical protein